MVHSLIVCPRQRAIGCEYFHVLHASESPLQAKLYGPGAVCIKRVQEGCPGNAICSSTRLKAGRIGRTRVATNDVVPATAWIVGIVNPKLRVVEHVEKLCTKLNFAGLREFEVL